MVGPVGAGHNAPFKISMETRCNYFTKLPKDVVYLILSHLNLTELTHFSLSSKRITIEHKKWWMPYLICQMYMPRGNELLFEMNGQDFRNNPRFVSSYRRMVESAKEKSSSANFLYEPNTFLTFLSSEAKVALFEKTSLKIEASFFGYFLLSAFNVIEIKDLENHHAFYKKHFENWNFPIVNATSKLVNNLVFRAKILKPHNIESLLDQYANQSPTNRVNLICEGGCDLATHGKVNEAIEIFNFLDNINFTRSNIGEMKSIIIKNTLKHLSRNFPKNSKVSKILSVYFANKLISHKSLRNIFNSNRDVIDYFYENGFWDQFEALFLTIEPFSERNIAMKYFYILMEQEWENKKNKIPLNGIFEPKQLDLLELFSRSRNQFIDPSSFKFFITRRTSSNVHELIEEFLQMVTQKRISAILYCDQLIEIYFLLDSNKAAWKYYKLAILDKQDINAIMSQVDETLRLFGKSEQADKIHQVHLKLQKIPKKQMHKKCILM